MKNLRRYLDWWIVTLSFFLFLGAESALMYGIYALLHKP